jgi:hypothetical protein
MQRDCKVAFASLFACSRVLVPPVLKDFQHDKMAVTILTEAVKLGRI